jgi:O-antigen ligase
VSGAFGSGAGPGPISTPPGPGAVGDPQGPISTLHIRREWWTTAIKAIPDDPIVGHGVAMFVDDTPEAHRMGVAGERTYLHNSPLESLYSLGLLGAIPYALFILSALVALVVLVRQGARSIAVVLGVGLWVFAFANANVSGEIGADAVLWASGALAVGLYAETARAR